MPTKAARKPLFARLKQGLDEGIAHAQGRLDLRMIEVPAAPPGIDAKSLVALRESIDMSQAVLARVLNVSTKTVQSWEQGTRKPSHASLRLIELLGKRPEVLLEMAGVQGVVSRARVTTVTVKGRTRMVVRESTRD